jgi:hypothetical protein
MGQDEDVAGIDPLRRSAGRILQYGGPSHDNVIGDLSRLKRTQGQAPGRCIQATDIETAAYGNKVKKRT